MQKNEGSLLENVDEDQNNFLEILGPIEEK